MAKKSVLPESPLDRSGELIKASMGKKPRTRKPERPQTGPKGGTTTVLKGGLVRRTVSFESEVWDRLRAMAFKQKRDITELVREAVRDYLKS